ncbi:hypothetical protein Patl1_12302 [Pistacia atlantica]|uniref:Uncharacterized protein n=1 Tax=Pistacia atlantica TaxID=434234 RepID=A0ACC1A515_9ROSI|nr:hypothetical protein Patl1_12302 [Pistacia atlantica]
MLMKICDIFAFILNASKSLPKVRLPISRGRDGLEVRPSGVGAANHSSKNAISINKFFLWVWCEYPDPKKTLWYLHQSSKEGAP